MFISEKDSILTIEEVIDDFYLTLDKTIYWISNASSKRYSNDCYLIYNITSSIIKIGLYIE